MEKFNGKRAAMLAILFAVLLVFAFSTIVLVKADETGETTQTATQTPRIWTDKEDYAPGETVIIYGEGFQGTVTITVIRPDGTVNDPENGIVGEWTVIADENGMFETTYKLDGILGEYTVTATDEYGSTATTTFTDANRVNFQTSGLPSGVIITINLTIDPGSDQKSVTFTSPGPSEEVTTGANKTVTYSGFPQSVTVGGFTYVLDGTSPSSPFSTGPRPGTVTVTATYKQYVPNADLYIMKSGPQYAHVGDTITFMFNVNNAGLDSATGVVVTDDKAGTATYASGDTNSNEMLDVGETWIFTATYEVSETDLDPLTNTATVTSKTLDPQISNNKASWSVDVLHPGIDVKKTGPEYAHEGETITYTITITNPSTDTVMYKVSVVDSLLGDISASFSDSLAPEASETKTFTYNVPSPSGDITNTVTVKYKDALDTEVTASASSTVDVLHPGIDVIKWANATMIHEGDWVKYNVTVVNTGDCYLTVTLKDDLLGISWTGTLGPGEKHEIIFDYQPTDDPTENTAIATGVDALGLEVSDSDSWNVDILHPGIDVSKSGPEYAHERDEITYTITVENTGDCPLYNVEIGESYAGTILVGYMDVGDKKTFEVKYTVPSPSGDITNVVNAQGEDVLGLLVQDDDSWSVDVLHPEISVSKSGPNYAHEGDIVTYTITVENTGDCELTGVTVIDDILGDLTSYLPDTTLTVGEVNQFTVNYEVPSPTGDITNTVEAKGEDALGLEVSDSDSWTVDILHPSIYVSKTGPVYAHEEDKITYNITVKNTGDCPLFNVVIKDETLNFEEEIDELAVGKEKTYEVEYAVESYGLLRNTVIASGEDALGLEVSDSASWTVTVLPKSMVTTSRLCYFDFDSAKEGQQFRLIFTQDPTNPSTYKLTASNPGQFYCNVFYIGTSGDSVSLTIKIPYPFVTQGAVPIHVYSDVDIVGGCFIPSGDITGSFSINPKIITFEDFTNGCVEITVSGSVPESGLVYVTIHLDYGLKKTVGYTPDSDKNAEKPIGTDVIVNGALYIFEVSGDLTDSQTIQSVNVFKRDPGFAGIVTDSQGNPLMDVEVKIYGSDGKLLATVKTDEDGWYFFNYKHTGKAATYKIVCNGNTKLVTVKANQLVQVDFTL